MNDNQQPPAPPDQLHPDVGDIRLHPDFGEEPVMFNMRDWLQKACEAAGGRMTGGSIGMGDADIDVELEGHLFNVSIRPIASRGNA